MELVQHAHRRGLLTRINTNGLLLDRSLVRELRKAGLTQGAVSIDDTDPETHDRTLAMWLEAYFVDRKRGD